MAYHAHTDGAHGGPADDPANYWDFGALSVALADFELPPEVVTAWHAARAAHVAYVAAADQFDSLAQVAHWRRWRALRSALPEVSHSTLRRLMVLLADVPTDRLAAVGATTQNGATA